MAKVFNYITDAFSELKTNVTWITWQEVQRYTIIVAVFTVLFSLFVFGVDIFFEKVVSLLFSIFKG